MAVQHGGGTMLIYTFEEPSLSRVHLPMKHRRLHQRRPAGPAFSSRHKTNITIKWHKGVEACRRGVFGRARPGLLGGSWGPCAGLELIDMQREELGGLPEPRKHLFLI